MVTDELPLLAQAEREVAEGRAAGRRAARASTFLAPLDPLAWDRDLLRSLFDFDYVWEVYVPAREAALGLLRPAAPVRRPARRADRAAHRPGGAAPSGSWGCGGRPGFDPLEAEGFVPALADALDAYRAFHGASRVTFPRDRASRALAGAVARAR